MFVVVIDDDPWIRDSLRVVLEYAGFETAAAPTGPEGIALVDCTRPDVVLLDVDLAGMNGIDVLKQLHATHESLPVVMMSADRSTAIVAAAKCAGACGFLEKPFDSVDRLLEAVNGR